MLLHSEIQYDSTVTFQIQIYTQRKKNMIIRCAFNHNYHFESSECLLPVPEIIILWSPAPEIVRESIDLVEIFSVEGSDTTKVLLIWTTRKENTLSLRPCSISPQA